MTEPHAERSRAARERLKRLWSERRARSLRERAGLWRYAASGGGIAFSLAAILLVNGYYTLLKQAAESGTVGHWTVLGGALLMAAALLWNPVRTYLAPPDLVFLLPYENEAAAYFRGALISGAAVTSLAAAFVFVLYLPFYRISMEAPPLYPAAALTALKALLFMGAWKERQFRFAVHRALLFAGKTAAAIATAYALFRYPPGADHAWLLLLWGVYAAALFVPASCCVNWPYLLDAERRAQSLQDAWFSQFVDLPRKAETFRRLALLDAPLRLLRYSRRNAAHYLAWRTLLRSTAASMAGRMTALAALMIWLFPRPSAAVPIYAAAVWLINMQLKSFSADCAADPLLEAVNPLPQSERRAARRAVRLAAGAAAALVLAVPLLAALPVPLAAVCAGAGLAAAFLFAGPRTKG